MKATFSALLSFLFAAGCEGANSTASLNQMMAAGFVTQVLDVPLEFMSDEDFVARMVVDPDPLVDDVGDNDSADTSDTKEGKLRGKVDNTNGGAARTVCAGDDRVRITATSSSPWRAIANLWITWPNGHTGICTGFFIGPRALGTAGHCLYNQAQGGFVRSIQVIPGRNGSVDPFGSQFAVQIFVANGFVQSASPDFDFGTIILPDTTLSNRVGYFSYINYADSQLRSVTLNTAGYPWDKGGTTQWHDDGAVNLLTTRRLTYFMDTAGGQSGSPVWVNSNGSSYIVGIHTNGGCPNGGVRVYQDVVNLFNDARKNFT